MYLGNSREDAERIISHPDIYPLVSDDSSPPREDFIAPDNALFVVAYDPEPIGCTMLHWRNGCTCEIHVQMLPQARSRSFEMGRATLAWIWDNIPVDKLVGLTHDKLTLHFALRLGFKKEGISPKSFKKNGQLIDQTYIGIERWHQQQQV